MPSLRTPWGKEVARRGAVRMRVKGATLSHYAIQPNDAHLIVSLARGAELHRAITSFACVIAKAMNAAAGRRGPVFQGRYHARSLETPNELWNGMRYLLTQAGHHGFDVPPAEDPYTSYTWCRERGCILGACWQYRLLGMHTEAGVRSGLDVLVGLRVEPEGDRSVGPPRLRRGRA
jgi:hypothetical protein